MDKFPYWIDSVNGDDNNSGTNMVDAWKTYKNVTKELLSLCPLGETALKIIGRKSIPV